MKMKIRGRGSTRRTREDFVFAFAFLGVIIMLVMSGLLGEEEEGVISSFNPYITKLSTNLRALTMFKVELLTVPYTESVRVNLQWNV